MPRANRHFLPGHVWHITHRCHEQKFLLKFARDRRRYLRWLFEAKKRFGLSVLDYMATSNHVHLLIKDTGPNVIARSMQLIAGRSAQEYNQRKTRQGAFWEDRYHATAIEADEHLHRCLVYIDLNMVRAGVVDHPVKWVNSGYHEIQQPPKRYSVIDLPGLAALCGFSKVADFQQAHRQWIEAALQSGSAVREARWSEAVAVGSLAFLEKVKSELGTKALHRELEEVDGTYALQEPGEAYRARFDIESEALTAKNTLPWKRILDIAVT
jgi:REP element-mobilizing transposase RayT